MTLFLYLQSMKKFGLIGRNIGYSFSRKYFAEKFKNLSITDCSYENFDIENITSVPDILTLPQLIGVNVTIPYKQEIIPYLDEISEEAQTIGAVNTITIQNGKTKGYNTDAFGFRQALEHHWNPCIHQNAKALILGDGGAAKAIHFVFNKMNIPWTTVSRKSEIHFENLSHHMVSEHLLIIQCTPVGTFPNVEEVLPFPFEAITQQHFIMDLIYNPSETLFMKKCKEKGAAVINGEEMLIGQAEKAWEIWNAR